MERRSRYCSVLAEAMEQFLAHKRALGRRFDTEERQLLLLDRFLVAEDRKLTGPAQPKIVPNRGPDHCTRDANMSRVKVASPTR